MISNIEILDGWEKTVEMPVGGLLYVGFSNEYQGKLLCISSQGISVIDCRNGTKIYCDGDYDESSFVAVCDELRDEQVPIAGVYGGMLSTSSGQGEKVLLNTDEKYITEVKFILVSGKVINLFKNYGFYTCGFSKCGNYFVFSHDGGIVILKRRGI